MKKLIIFLIIAFLGSPAVPAGEDSFAFAAVAQTASKKKSTKKKTGSAPSANKKKNAKGTGKGKSSAAAAKPRTAEQVKAAKTQNAKQIKETKQKITLNTRETEKRLNQLNLLEGEIDVCAGSIARLQARADSISGVSQQLADSIARLDKHLADIKKQYVIALKKTQSQRNASGALAFIFSSNSFAQAYRRANSLKQFARWRDRRAGEIAQVRTDLDAKRAHLDSLGAIAARNLSQLNSEYNTLSAKQKETSNLVNKLKREGGELKQIMARKQREAASLDQELDRIIAEEAARQERLRREREAKAKAEAERKAKEEAERLAREQKAQQEAESQAAREAEAKAEAARKAEAEAKAKAEAAEKKAASDAADKAAKEQAKKDREAARKAEEARKKAEKEAAREKARKGKPVKHKGKNNNPEAAPAASSTAPASTGVTPTLKAPKAAGESGVANGAVKPAKGSFADQKGKLPYPVSGRYTIVKRFGRQQHPTLPHVQINNSGIDLQTAPSTPVMAVFDGEISAVFPLEGYNNVVVIRHGEYMTVYSNLGSTSVTTGQKVKAGQKLGTVYADPNDDNRSVLHFEIRHLKAKENPELWLRR